MNSQKIVNLLTVCRRAGKAVLGFDAAVAEIKTGKALRILLAEDISPKTEKEIRFICTKHNTEVDKTEITAEEFERCLNKKVAVIAVCDAGFAERFGELLQ